MRGRVRPFLWFDDNAEEAANFYVALFPGAKMLGVSRRGDGAVVTAAFQVEGQELIALNGGPAYSLTPAFSLMVECDTQAEVDRLWNALAEGGCEMQCGWVSDRFGLTWQIVPSVLFDLLHDEDDARSSRVMAAMLQMKKLDIAALENA